MANINQISPDGGTTVYDIEDPTARSSVSRLSSTVGILSSKVSNLESVTLGLEDDIDHIEDSLGTASTKNSTSVVTSSSDLVESGAVKDIVGWGNKNELNNIAVTGSLAGINYTVDADKIITLVNGVSSSTMFLKIGKIPSKGTWILSGVTGGSPTTYGMTVRTNDLQNPSFGAVDNYDGDTTFTIPESYNNDLFVFIRVPSGKSVDNYVVKPMLRRSGTATYEPYHASVEESLAEKCDNSVIGTVEDGTNPTKAYAVREHMVRGGKFCTVTVPVTTSSTWTLGGNYVEGDVASEFSAIDNKILPINKKDVTTSTPAEFTLENSTVYILAVATGYIGKSGKQYASLIFVASDGTIDEYKLAEQSLTVLTVDTSVNGKIKISCTASTFKAALIKLVTR